MMHCPLYTELRVACLARVVSGRKWVRQKAGLGFLMIWVLPLFACATAEKTAPEPMRLDTGVATSAQKILWHHSYKFDDESVLAYGQAMRPGWSSHARSLFVAWDGGLQSIEVSDGHVRWDHAFAKDPRDPVHISGGVGANDAIVIAATLDGAVITLSVKDGKPEWQHSLASEILSPPAANVDKVVFHSGDGRLICLNAVSGRRLWVYSETLPKLTLRGTSAPLIVGDKVLAGFADGHLIALDLATGSVLWDVTVAEPEGHSSLARMADIDADLVAVDGLVYASAYQGKTVAVAIATGRLVWSRDIASFTGISVAGDRLYMTGPASEVWAMDRHSGEILWQQMALKYRHISAPIAFPDGVYVADFEGYIHRLSPRDGHIIDRNKLSGADEYTPMLMRIDDHLLVSGGGGQLWLLSTDEAP